MEGFTPEIGMYLLATFVAGLLLGWLFRGPQSNRRINQVSDEWQSKVDDVSRQKDRCVTEMGSLRSTIESQQGVVRRHEIAIAKARTELESAHEKEKLMSKNIFTLRAEREDTKGKLVHFQNAMVSVKQQSAELQAEFLKAGEFYKGELTKAFEKRKALEVRIENARAEHESFSNLLQASRSEKESVNKMLDSAQTRLANLDKLEQGVIALEAENAQLKHDASGVQQEIEALERDVAELEELRVQNKELAHCLKSMENSRKQYEDDAKRHRDHAGQQEQQSETLRIKLDEVERNFVDMEKQQRHALKEARNTAKASKTNGTKPPKQEVDDLKEIVGIGKVFEQALNELGIVNYRQIAAFGIADIARVNASLKEFKGRMEQDDWIGQAKDLHFKKYGGTDQD